MTEEERARFLDNITSDVHRMERLVTRLLQLARIQSAPGEAEEVAVKPFFEKLAARYPAPVRFDVSAAPPSIVIHQDHFESAIRNLVDNAVRHGEGKPVDVIATSDDGRLVVKVIDHGPGISDGNRDRIFRRFFTTERDRGGTGLGLSIVEAVARTRGGSVTFDTSTSGTTFALKL
jgi:two-component system sensor histidine kinase ChvG